MAIILAVCTFFSTLSGGLVSLKYKDKLHVILGFTAGVLLAVVAFDLLPEIMSLVKDNVVSPRVPMVALIVGFLIFHILEKTLLIHHAQEETYGSHKHPTIGTLSALALTGHSFLDGVGIGLGFQVSRAVGILVAIAVISHDFSDGLNTASLMLVHGNTSNRSLMYVLLDAAAPVFGAFSTLFFSVPRDVLAIYLGFFAGFLLCISASDILPEAHSPRPSYQPIVMTVVGMLFIYLVTRFI